MASSELRSSYGGGFTVLDTTGWKGTDRQEDATEDLLEAPVGIEANKSFLPATSDEKCNSVIASSTPELADLPGRSSVATQVSRPSSAASGALQISRPSSASRASVPGIKHRALVTSAAGQLVRSQSTPDLAAADERIRLPRPQSACNLPMPPRLSVLHGPPERREHLLSAPQAGSIHSQQPSRPRSAAGQLQSRPQGAAIQPQSRQTNTLASRSVANDQSSRPQSAAARKRPGSAGCYGSAIFDSRKEAR